VGQRTFLEANTIMRWARAGVVRERAHGMRTGAAVKVPDERSAREAGATVAPRPRAGACAAGAFGSRRVAVGRVVKELEAVAVQDMWRIVEFVEAHSFLHRRLVERASGLLKASGH
jgi:hypothetical protein